MLKTEQEAAELWCPMARIGHLGSGATVNDPSAPDFKGRCIGTKCAMWRWAQHNSWEKQPRGYCGLAGRPEVNRG